jgi:hypothetical protein
MERMICLECGIEIPKAAWSCPHCGKPGETRGVPTAKEISPKGMILLLLMFVVFPIVLFLIHIFVPGM